MKQYINHLLHTLPYLLCLLLLLLSPPLQAFTLGNIMVQAILFLLVCVIPAIKTGRMSYVDIAWPLGLFFIGVQVLLFSEELTLRSYIIAGLYMFAGGRMSAMAFIGLKLGYLNKELPRYQYQRLRWQRRGWQEKPAMLFEVASQGFANMTVLALPAILQASNTSPDLSLLEMFGYGLWVAAFAFEFIADAQKARFGLRMHREKRKGEHCEYGLWKYSRHPNYFGEWMVWNAMVISTIPALLVLSGSLAIWHTLAFGIALIYLSYVMYVVLTHYSGAVPSEYYSAQKRSGYVEYQRTTNMFFPGPRKSG
jgi:steroid 5-alpha reductase family enzyme